jgi:hypothetical protein
VRMCGLRAHCMARRVIMKAVGLQGTRMLDFRLPCAVCYDAQRAMSGSAAQATFLESGASFGQSTSFIHSA